MIGSLLRRASVRYLRARPAQSALVVASIAVGVAAAVAIELSTASAGRAFEMSRRAVLGRATHVIVGGPAGIDETLYRRLRVELGLRGVTPIIEGWARIPERPGLALRVLGIDLVAEAMLNPELAVATQVSPRTLVPLLTRPGTVIASDETARLLGAAVGQSFEIEVRGRKRSAELLATLPARGAAQLVLDGLLVVDIATAQEWVDQLGRLTAIHVQLGDGRAGESDATRIRAILPADARLVETQRHGGAGARLSAAFELNLRAMSLLALIVGVFLVYNTVTFSVVQRRELFGSLRCLGVTRRQLATLVLAEATVLGALGAIAGLGGGVVLTHALLQVVTRTISDHYFVVSVREVVVSPTLVAEGLLLGVGGALFAAAFPAWESTTSAPRAVLVRSAYEARVRRRAPAVVACGLAAFALGGGLLLLPGGGARTGLVAVFAMMLGAGAFTPVGTLVLLPVVQRCLGAVSLLARMAARDVTAALSRTSMAITALMIAVAVSVGMGLMVTSFRRSVTDWLEAVLRADVIVRAVGGPNEMVPLAADLDARLASARGVAAVRRYRQLSLETADGPVRLFAAEVRDERDRHMFTVVEPSPATAWDAVALGAVLVSETLAYERRLEVGGSLHLDTPQGPHAFRVAGIYRNYDSEPVALLSLETYRSHWADSSLTALALYATPEAGDPTAWLDDLRVAAGGEQALVFQASRAIRTMALEVFDRTFVVTSVFEVLALLVALVGIVSALMAIALERAREIAVLRAHGLTRAQVFGVVTWQTGLMGGIAGFLAIPVGTMLAALLVFVVNRRSFGWTIDLHLEPSILAEGVVVAVAAAVVAGLYPAWRMSRTPPALALRME